MNARRIQTLAVFAAPLLAIVAALAAVTKDQPMPFRPGETLNYRVSWSAFTNAASVQLSVPERRSLFSWQTWHFRAVAQTLSPVAAMAPVDDQFDSYTDSASLESRQFESHLREFGKTTDAVQHLVATGQPSKIPGPSVIVSPGTRDALGELLLPARRPVGQPARTSHPRLRRPRRLRNTRPPRPQPRARHRSRWRLHCLAHLHQRLSARKGSLRDPHRRLARKRSPPHTRGDAGHPALRHTARRTHPRTKIIVWECALLWL